MKKDVPPGSSSANSSLIRSKPQVKSEVIARQNKPFAHPKYQAALILIDDLN